MNRGTPSGAEPDHPLLVAMREQGHEPIFTTINTATTYIEARCRRCQARAWGWHNAQGSFRREDIEGPAIMTLCAP